MNTATRIATTLGIGLLTVSILSACSNEEEPLKNKNTLPAPTESISPTPTVVPEETTSPEPEPEITSFADFVYDDQDDITWQYNVDLNELYDADVVANFEQDVNSLYHVMLDGFLTDFIYPYNGPDSERLYSVGPFLTENAYTILETAYENDNWGVYDALIAQPGPDNTINIGGETYTLREENPITMLRRFDPVIQVNELGTEGSTGVQVERDVTVNYHTSDGQRIWIDSTVQYAVQPNAEGRWIIDEWYQNPFDWGISDTEY